MAEAVLLSALVEVKRGALLSEYFPDGSSEDLHPAGSVCSLASHIAEPAAETVQFSSTDELEMMQAVRSSSGEEASEALERIRQIGDPATLGTPHFEPVQVGVFSPRLIGRNTYGEISIPLNLDSDAEHIVQKVRRRGFFIQGRALTSEVERAESPNGLSAPYSPPFAARPIVRKPVVLTAGATQELEANITQIAKDLVLQFQESDSFVNETLLEFEDTQMSRRLTPSAHIHPRASKLQRTLTNYLGKMEYEYGVVATIDVKALLPRIVEFVLQNTVEGVVGVAYLDDSIASKKEVRVFGRNDKVPKRLFLNQVQLVVALSQKGDGSAGDRAKLCCAKLFNTGQVVISSCENLEEACMAALYVLYALKRADEAQCRDLNVTKVKSIMANCVCCVPYSESNYVVSPERLMDFLSRHPEYMQHVTSYVYKRDSKCPTIQIRYSAEALTPDLQDREEGRHDMYIGVYLTGKVMLSARNLTEVQKGYNFICKILVENYLEIRDRVLSAADAKTMKQFETKKRTPRGKK